MSQASQMSSALAKAAQKGYPGLAGSTGFPKSGATKNSAQFKPVGAKKAKIASPAKKAKTFSATKFNNQKAKTFGLTK